MRFTFVESVCEGIGARIGLWKTVVKASKQSFHVAVSASLANEMPPLQPLPREDHEPCANDKSIRSPASGLKIITAAFKRASSAPRVQLLEPYVPKVAWGNRLVSFVRTYARGLELKVPKVTNVWNVMFQRLLTFRTLCSKGRLRKQFRFARTHTRARGLERKAPKIRNVWNGMFQRLATFGTVRSKGCQRLERYVPKVANV